MSHPFEVGKEYRNRVGEYTVQAIEGDWMKLRYASGGTLETRVSIQARIWENIQLEAQAAQEEERLRLAREARLAARRRSGRAKKAKAKPKFAGFEEIDFEPKSRGLSWSSRKEQGKVLAYELHQRTKGEFDSWIVPRKSAVDVGRKDHYNLKARETNSAFFVSAEEDGLTFGFRVAKPDGKAKAKSALSLFVAALEEDDQVRRTFRAAMKKHELSFDVYAMDVSFGQVGRFSHQDRGFLWEHESADQAVSKKMNWPKLIEYLETTAAKKRCELYLRKQIPVDDAVEAGAGISAQLATLFEVLMPIYDASLGK